MCLVKREYFTFCGDTNDDCCVDETPLMLCDDQENCENEYIERWISDYCRDHPFDDGDELDSDSDEEDEAKNEDEDKKGVEKGNEAAGESQRSPAEFDTDKMELDTPRSVPLAVETGVNVPTSQERQHTRRNDNAHAAIGTSFFDDAVPSATSAQSIDTSKALGVDMGMGNPPVFHEHIFSLTRNESTQSNLAVAPFTDINGVSYTQNLAIFEQPAFGPGFEPAGDNQDAPEDFARQFILVDTTSTSTPAADTTARSDADINDVPALSDITIDMGALQEFDDIVGPLRTGTPAAPSTPPHAQASEVAPETETEAPSATPAGAETQLSHDNRAVVNNTNTVHDADNDSNVPVPVAVPAPSPAPSITITDDTNTIGNDTTTPSPYTIISARQTPTPTLTPTPMSGQGAGPSDADDDDDEEEEKRPKKRRRKGARLSMRKYGWRRRGANAEEQSIV